jgi:hypothetical protein
VRSAEHAPSQVQLHAGRCARDGMAPADREVAQEAHHGLHELV